MKSILLFLGFAIILSNCSQEHKHPKAPYDGSKVQIERGLLKEGIPVFYAFQDGNETIPFFVLNVKNEIHSYFDACNDCYRNKLGYRYEDGKIICNFCNESYQIYKLKDGMGGCYPIKLKGTLNGGIYEIDKESLIEGKKYF
jgi:uncharacterized membrane protein